MIFDHKRENAVSAMFFLFSDDKCPRQIKMNGHGFSRGGDFEFRNQKIKYNRCFKESRLQSMKMWNQSYKDNLCIDPAHRMAKFNQTWKNQKRSDGSLVFFLNQKKLDILENAMTIKKAWPRIKDYFTLKNNESL